MSDAHNLKQRLSIAVQKADEVVNQTHVAADIKSIVREMRDIAEGFGHEMANTRDSSADTRFMKKKLDQAVKDHRSLELKIDDVKKAIGELVVELKTIGGEVGGILKRHDPSSGDDDCFAALKIKAATQKMAEIVVKLSSDTK